MNKIKAFTLVEVIMVMILSLLVVGIILLGFRHFQQYSAMQEKNAGKLSEVLLVHNALSNWFQSAHTIQLEDELMVFRDSMVIGTCVFGEKLLILNKGMAGDTFALKPRNVRILNEGDSPWVKELCFELGDTNRSYSFQFRKEYGKAVLFNRKE